MKKLLIAVVLGLLGTGAHAQALDCQQVDELGESLTTLGVALEDENMPIDAGSAEHLGLAQTVEGLAFIAGAEGDEDLQQAALDMAAAWDANDRDAFTDGLATAVAKLAIISANECQ